MRIEHILSPQTHASRHHHGEDHGEADRGVQRDVRGVRPRRSSAGPAGAGGVQRSQQGTLALSFRARYRQTLAHSTVQSNCSDKQYLFPKPKSFVTYKCLYHDFTV